MVKKAASTSKTSKKQVTEVKEATPPTTVVKEENKVVEPGLNDAFDNILQQLVACRSAITVLSSQVRQLKARSEREVKNAHKLSKKRKNANRKPSGFVKPAIISTELATFLNKPQGSEMARTEVTKEINVYIKQHNLQDPANGRRILPDAKLRKLLKLSKSDELTYFNLQKYMSPHFPPRKVVQTQ